VGIGEPRESDRAVVGISLADGFLSNETIFMDLIQ
jgi:hypothetical protein